ncbi:MarR family transcriptional regulator [Methanosarcina siciliae]|uniref:MarR family transcriptional regulator n=1 Tax=Methanosarcina siciliae TaxID=38027 RepID=UPI0011E5C02D
MLHFISENKYISAQELATLLGISSHAVEKQIANLKDKGLLKRIGPDKGGYWEVNMENRELNS